MSDHKRSNSGFSIIEVLISIGILGTVSAALVTLVGTISRSQVDLTTKLDAVEQTSVIQALLLTEKACSNSFGGLDPAANTAVASIKTSDGSDLVQVGSTKTITKAILGAYVPDPHNFAKITLTFSTVGSSIPLKPRDIRLAIQQDASNKITRCSASGFSDPHVVLANVGCSGGRVLQGFDSSGNAICVAHTGAAPSACGGTRAFGEVIGTAPDDGSGSLSGRVCGATTGRVKECYSCSAQWIYPNGAPVSGSQVECRCH